MTIATLKLATPTGNQPMLDSPVPLPTVVTAIAAASSLAACGGAAPARTHGGCGVAALGTYAGDQQRKGRRQRPHPVDFCRVGSAHHQAELSIEVPGAVGQGGKVLKQRGLAKQVGQALALQVVAAGVGRAA